MDSSYFETWADPCETLECVCFRIRIWVCLCFVCEYVCTYVYVGYSHGKYHLFYIYIFQLCTASWEIYFFIVFISKNNKY